MDTKTIDRIKKLRATSVALGSFFESFRTKTAPSVVDKHGAGFNLDQRFSSFKVVLSFDSWMGEYGCSSCHSVLGVDPSLAADAMVKAINIHKEQLFSEASRILVEEAKGLTADAQREIESLQKLVSDLAA